LAQQRQGTNFASGRISSDSTDAINGSQLFAAFSEIGKTHTRVDDLEARMEALPAPGTNAGQTGVAESVRAAIGDGAVINDAGALVMPEITLKSLGATVDGNGNTIPAEQPSTVLGAIAALDHEMVKNDRAIGAIIESSLLWHPEKNAFDAERNIPQLDGDGKQLLDSDGNPLSVRQNGKITNLAPGALTPQSSDAVTGGQLSATNDRVSDLATKADRLGEDALLWNETTGAFDARHGTSQTNKISNIADGVLTHDAVNLGQLQTVAAAASTAQSAADTARTAADHAQASADNAQTTANAAQDRADRALSAADRAGAQLAGMGADETVLGRIEDAGKATASALGGGSTVNTDGRITAPEYKVAAIDRDGRVAETPESHSNVGAAVAALDANIGTVNDRVSDLALIQAQDISYDTASGGGRANTVTLLGGDPNAPVLLKNVADGIDAQDSVNVRQLSQAKQDILAQSAEYSHQSRDYADQADMVILEQGRSYSDEIGAQALRSSKEYTDRKVSHLKQDVGELTNKLEQGFGQLSSDIRDVRGEARRAAAIGLAAASLKFDDRPGKLSLAFGGGVWRGHGAAAFGLGYTNESSNLRANLTATSSGGHLGMGGGVSFTLN
jgi:autotransporter adhesin